MQTQLLEQELEAAAAALHETGIQPAPRRFAPVWPWPAQQAAAVTLVLFAVRGDGQFTGDCRFEISVGGGPFAPVSLVNPLSASLPLPSAPRPLTVTVRVTPRIADRWTAVGQFECAANGVVSAIAAPDFWPPQIQPQLGGAAVVPLVAVLSRVKDATAQVLQSLAQVPASRQSAPPANWPLSAWNTPPLPAHNYIGSPPILGPNLNFDAQGVAPAAESLVLEVAGVTAPKLIAICWPHAVPRLGAPFGAATPFLINFRPTVGQNVGAGFFVGPGLGTYPFGWDYLFFGLWRVVNYMGDPLTVDPFAKGLPYQMAISGRHAVTVCPLNKVGAELGEFMRAAVAEEILREIQGFMLRRAGVFTVPPVGRVAIGAFSSGNLLLAQFLASAANRGHNFNQNLLKEVFMFDPPASLVPTVVSAAQSWASRGAAADKMIRAYTQSSHAIYRQMLGTSAPGAGPVVAESATRLRSAAVLPIAAWQRARGSRSTGFQEAHQLISAMMLTDALRRSGF